MFSIIDTRVDVDVPDVDRIDPISIPGYGLRGTGEPFARVFPDVCICVRTLKRLPDIWEAAYFLMSPRCIEAVRALGETHFQDFPVRFESRSGRVDETSMRILHVVDPVPCMDMQRSRYDYQFIAKERRRLVTSIHSVVLHEDRIPSDRHLFKMAEIPRGNLHFISDALRDRFEAMEVTGAKFIPPQKYRT